MQIVDLALDLVLTLIPFLIWYYRGQSRDFFPSMEDAPPENILPSEIGYLLTGKTSDMEIAVIILNWAENGYIRIHSGVDFHIQKLKDLPYNARQYEIYLFDNLFNRYGDGEIFRRVNIISAIYGRIRRTRGKLVKHFTSNPEFRLYSADSAKNIVLVGFFALLPVAKLLIIEMVLLRNTFRFGPGITISISAFILVALYFISFLLARPKQLRTDKAWLFIMFALILSTGLAILLTAFMIIGGGTSGFRYVFSVITAFIITIVMNMMTRMTSYGEQQYEHALGFRNYILNANDDALKQSSEKDSSLFFRLMPYAVSMKISRQWARHFDPIELKVPDWIVIPGKTSLTATDFDREIINLLRGIRKSFFRK